MYSLPIIRPKTLADPEKPTLCPDLYGCSETGPNGPGTEPGGTGGGGTGPVVPKKLKSALRLIQMTFNHFSLIISGNRKNLAYWGSLQYGNVGGTGTEDRPTPATIDWANGTPELIFKAISHGYRTGYTIFKTEINNLYGTGYNGDYVLNRSDVDTNSVYKLITKNVIDFCITTSNYLGWSYMLFVKSDNKVYGLGPNNIGFGLGAEAKDLNIDDGTNINYLGVDNAENVFCTNPTGLPKSFVLKKDKTVVACGYNTDGCLGINSVEVSIDTWQPVQTSYDNGVTFKPLTGVVDIVTTNYVYRGGAAGAGSPWAGVTGNKHMATYFLIEDGSVYTCGNNIYGQLGLGLQTTETRNYATKTSITKAVSMCTTAGGTSVLITTSEDKVFTWGNNQWGQLGTGDLNNKLSPTEIVIPNKKIKMIHGGGMYGNVNGGFLVVFQDGDLYAAGYNQTYSLGITKNGIPDTGPIKTFSRNEYFGVNPPQNQDPQRYPLTNFTGLLARNSDTITNAQVYEDKIVYGKKLSIYVIKGMMVSGTGIEPDTRVISIDYIKKEIVLSKPAILTRQSTDLRFDVVIKVYQADLCGYGTEMAQKVVTEDGSLYMSGWNQLIGSTYNFNYYYKDYDKFPQLNGGSVDADGNVLTKGDGQKVAVPTYFDALFS